MSTQTTYPMTATSEPDNNLLRRILYALANSGAQGMAPQLPSNTLLRQILWQLQNNFPGGNTGPQNSIQLKDQVTGQTWTLTMNNGLLEWN